MSHLNLKALAMISLVLAFSCKLYAVDGVILIDQNRALAGGITPGDTPGFPVTITKSGSYRLTGNLTVPDANTTAIVITASSVSIDLNGYGLIGPVSCNTSPAVSCSTAGTGDGVDCGITAFITVTNGFIQGMGNDGISCYQSGVGGHIFQGLRVQSNAGNGINVGNATVSGNTVSVNTGAGITVAYSSVIGNVVTYSKFSGIIAVYCPGVIINNTAVFNGAGENIRTLDPTCVVVNNTAP